MFPARAGMSRRAARVSFKISDVPRASGDEPAEDEIKLSDIRCSPRERG